MVVESLPQAFSEWLGPAILYFLKAGAGLALVALVIGYLVTAFRYGPLKGGDLTFRVISSSARQFVQFSPRRVLAMATLAVQESVRRRVLVAYAVFLLILLFAGWFLDTTTRDPSTLYLSFVLTATTYLVLLMALFLSAFSIPTDIKNRTIYTVVTKPVRPGEIVLGRMLGFSIIGTVLLAVMGVFSYFFVVRLLDHTHEVDLRSLKTAGGQSAGIKTGRTEIAQHHRHEVTLEPNGNLFVKQDHGHTHEAVATQQGERRVGVGKPQGVFRARVPVYGKLRFKDRGGRDVARGVNVGNEWGYRSFIDGGTLAAAIWTFEGITPEKYQDNLPPEEQGLPLEMTLRVFRTFKGEIGKGLLGSIVLKNPKDPTKASRLNTFEAKDAEIDRHLIKPDLVDTDGKPINLFKDLAPEGKVEVWVNCLDTGQYFGAAQPDLYIRARDNSFEMNFVKGYFGIWLQMLLVTGLGVMYSTFLSGAVAMMATVTSIVVGFFTTFVIGVAEGIVRGGGPIESLIRLVTQQNLTNEFSQGLTKDVVQSIDALIMSLMKVAAQLLPDFNRFGNVDYVAHGFDIPADLLLAQIVTAGAYLFAMFIVGYIFLKTREIAR